MKTLRILVSAIEDPCHHPGFMSECVSKEYDADIMRRHRKNFQNILSWKGCDVSCAKRSRRNWIPCQMNLFQVKTDWQ